MNVTHSDLLRLAKRIGDTVGIPEGGTPGQILKKNSATDYDTVWANDSVGVPGAFDPTLYGSTTDGSLTYTTQYGFYEIVGKRVNIDARIVINAVSTAPTGNLRLGGLPVEVANSTNYRGVLNVFTSGVNWGTGKTQVVGYANGNTRSIEFFAMQNNASFAAVAGGDIAAGDIIIVSGFYMID